MAGGGGGREGVLYVMAFQEEVRDFVISLKDQVGRKGISREENTFCGSRLREYHPAGKLLVEYRAHTVWS